MAKSKPTSKKKSALNPTETTKAVNVSKAEKAKQELLEFIEKAKYKKYIWFITPDTYYSLGIPKKDKSKIFIERGEDIANAQPDEAKIFTKAQMIERIEKGLIEQLTKD